MGEQDAMTGEHVVVQVSLLGSDPVVWRQLGIAGDLTLDRVHEVFQAALGWEDMHLHRFTVKDPYLRITKEDLAFAWPLQWVPAEYVEEDYDRAEEQMTLAGLLAAGGGSAFYEYDFGDSWLHLIEAAGSEPAGTDPARILDGGNACPPEDCGGLHSHAELVDALADPADLPYEEALERLGDPGVGFDAHLFDRARCAAELAAVVRGWRRSRRR